MKKKIFIWLSALAIIINVFLPSTLKNAKAAATHDSVITEINITDTNGKPIPGNSVEMWQQFRVNAKFALPDNIVKEGDTTTIRLPEQLTFQSTVNFDVKDSSGNLVAKAEVNNQAKTITLRYTKYPENRSDVKGSLYFNARVDHSKVKQKQDIELKFQIGNRIIAGGKLDYKGPGKKYETIIEKSGWQDNQDKSLFHYGIAINRSKADLKDAWVKDRLVDTYGVEVVPNSIKIYKVEWYWDNGEWKHKGDVDVTPNFKSNIEVDADKQGFNIRLGNIGTEQYYIKYDIKANYTPTHGEIFKNNATLKYNGKIQKDVNFTLQYLEAGGRAEGYVYSINIHKKDKDGKSLQGAEFQLTRDANGKVIGTYKTDANGNIKITGLLKDKYTLKETKAPEGYKLDQKEIKIEPKDFGSDKSLTKEVINEKDNPKIKVSGEKTWED
ncbi:Ig-like domain-containing protein, partial [Gemella cuniculi]|uniref:Ig-like domain-containing protein n=1 Tax=Gemella cuniculi TaxID=150240 RepID=UPI001B7FD45D